MRTTLVLLAVVYGLLLLSRPLAGLLGEGRALSILYGLAAALLWRLRSRGEPSPLPGRLVGLGRALAFGLSAGVLLQPVLVAGIAVVGRAIGLEITPSGRVAMPSWGFWFAVVCLAPIFEELLYRERLLVNFRIRLGVPAAVVLSSAAFAVSHVEPWPVLGAFVAGLALASWMLVTRCIVSCIALHAGLNLVPLMLFAGAPAWLGDSTLGVDLVMRMLAVLVLLLAAAKCAGRTDSTEHRI